VRSSLRRQLGRCFSHLGVHNLEVYQGRTEIAQLIAQVAGHARPQAQCASVADLSEIVEHSEAPTRARIEAAQRRGSECWVLRIDGALAGYTWIPRSVVDLAPIVVLPLARGEAYQHLSYTFEPFRGRGVFQQLIRAVALQLAREDFAWIINYVDRDNTPSIRARQRSGAQLSRVAWIKLPGFRAFALHPPD
jgi:ribosomal protein S18 acetylase RimI-like enzyme